MTTEPTDPPVEKALTDKVDEVAELFSGEVDRHLKPRVDTGSQDGLERARTEIGRHVVGIGVVGAQRVWTSRWCAMAASNVPNTPLWKKAGAALRLRSGAVRNV